MSSAKPARVAAEVRDALVTLLWRQWSAIGGAASAQPARSQVDPEALILGSLGLESAEPRLWVVMRDWLREGTRLLSVQRLENTCRLFDESIKSHLGRVAWVAVHEAMDARWRRLAKGVEPPSSDGARRRSRGVALDAPAALILRLRSAFGVGVKADVLAFLLGRSAEPSRTALIVRATAYTQPSVFRALKELVAAGLVNASRSAPAEYWVDVAPWRRFLRLAERAPPWCYWSDVIAYGLRFLGWAAARSERPATDYALGALWRSLAEEGESVFTLTGIATREEPFPESADVEEWARLHQRLAMWIEASA
ncbi:MAG: hypothetical protein ACE5PT_09735 [Gemmatimonadales bacterium]